MITPPDAQQIARYQQWEQQTRSDLPGRYSMGFSGSPVFAIENDDRPLATEPVRLEPYENGVTVCCGEGPSALRVNCDGVGAELLRRLLQSLNGETTFAAACEQASPGFPREPLRQLCQLLLGRSLSIEDAVDALESRIRRAEIVRFPMQSPYLLLRSYWSNCADARAFMPEFMAHVGAPAAFREALAALHTLTTMGRGLDSFYGGSGSVPTIPGGYRAHPMRTGLSAGKARFIDAWVRELGLNALRVDDRLLYSEQGALLGATADQGRTFRHPPPDHGVLERLLEDMRALLAQVAALPDGGRDPRLPRLLSRFHKLFLHAHPFYNINNSVAMNIVNYHLARAGFGVIPHLLLDFIALRTDFEDYAVLFSRAVGDFALTSREWWNERDALQRIAAYHVRLQSAEQEAGA